MFTDPRPAQPRPGPGPILRGPRTDHSWVSLVTACRGGWRRQGRVTPATHIWIIKYFSMELRTWRPTVINSCYQQRIRKLHEDKKHGCLSNISWLSTENIYVVSGRHGRVSGAVSRCRLGTGPAHRTCVRHRHRRGRAARSFPSRSSRLSSADIYRKFPSRAGCISQATSWAHVAPGQVPLSHS